MADSFRQRISRSLFYHRSRRCQHKKRRIFAGFLCSFSLAETPQADILTKDYFVVIYRSYTMTEQKLLPIDHCRHLAFAAIGGFFGGYALLCRGGILGSSQTINLLELVIDALFGRGSSVLLHLLCLVIYVVGVMLSVIVPHVFHVDMRRLSPCITAAAAIAMGGNVRVGFEDNIYLGKGQKAASNGELVAKVVRIAKELGREIATPAEAREILSLKPLK